MCVTMEIYVFKYFKFLVLHVRICIAMKYECNYVNR